MHPSDHRRHHVQRRDVLRLAFCGGASLACGLLAVPRQAAALGGTLPDLDHAAPDFRLQGIRPGRGGELEEAELGLQDFAGHWLVLYFYPRDFTEGCTLEARGFQRDLRRYRALDATVVGISADDPGSHAEFCGSEGLSYPLLSDPGGRVSQAYGSWLPPFSQRHTFLIDPEGTLRARWVAVRPAGHSAEVLASLAALR
ncbi:MULTISPECIES: peroxiredoxin [Aphanothece]|uniref:peroxiredoxin n=1 Tax=Aphanothece TaxID=1121 RepID=UPI003985570C